MHLLHFLNLALPWFKKQLFTQKNKGFLDKISDLTHTFTDNYSNLLNDSDNLLKFQTQAFEMYQQYIQSICNDKINARSRDLAHLHKNGQNKRADIMIYGAAFGLFACIGTLWFCRHMLSMELVSIISAIIGIIGSCLKDAYAFEFGTSKIELKNNEHLSLQECLTPKSHEITLPFKQKTKKYTNKNQSIQNMGLNAWHR